MKSEIAARADFTRVRYAQCWEDADILLEGLDIQPGDVCLSIASAGDNVLAMLARNPSRVIALDLSAAQIACLELRVAAFRVLDHNEVLELIGSRPSTRRWVLYRRCDGLLSTESRRIWDTRPQNIERGIGSVGKLERYLAVFRRWLLPMIHPRSRVSALFDQENRAQRIAFYDGVWNNKRWRILLQIFFSRFLLGQMGRDPSFFRYVKENGTTKLLERMRHAMTELDPTDNPYLHWALTGRHGEALPFALRPENFDKIRANLDCLEWRQQSLEDFLDGTEDGAIDRFNLSDVFEYTSRARYHQLLEQLVRRGRSGARLAYWNFRAHRRRPPFMADRLRSLNELANDLHGRDKTFFYNAFVIEEVT